MVDRDGVDFGLLTVRLSRVDSGGWAASGAGRHLSAHASHNTRLAWQIQAGPLVVYTIYPTYLTTLVVD